MSDVDPIEAVERRWAEYEALRDGPHSQEVERARCFFYEAFRAALPALVAMRETNNRLNRRAQAAESGVKDAIRGAGDRTLGRALANAGYSACMAECAALRARVRELAEVCDDIGLAMESAASAGWSVHYAVALEWAARLRAASRGAQP